MPEPDIVDQITKIISTIGFPIAVTCWLLWRDWKIMHELKDVIMHLSSIVETLVVVLDIQTNPRG